MTPEQVLASAERWFKGSRAATGHGTWRIGSITVDADARRAFDTETGSILWLQDDGRWTSRPWTRPPDAKPNGHDRTAKARQGGAKADWTSEAAPMAGSAAIADDGALTEDAASLEFAKRYQDKLLFCHDHGAWFTWTGSHWRQEGTGLAFDRAREIVRALSETASAKIQERARSSRFAAGVERFSRNARCFAVTAERWDADPFLLATPAGTLDLHSGELRPARPEDYITKVTAVAPAPPGASHPLWTQFLDEATGGDAGLQRFLQQIAGYALTGDIREHALFFVFGDGGNGKGVYHRALIDILADHAVTAPMETFTASKYDRHPTEIAMLRGARLVTASETEEGRNWAESRIKQLTGGDKVTARFMRQDDFTFRPMFKLLIIGNHQPALHNVDAAMRRRFNIIPFAHRPPVPDLELGDKLVAEYPAILRWMIGGCLDWQAHGLVRPDVVREATEQYFSDQDLIGQWLDECCEIQASFADMSETLFKSWSTWAAKAGEEAGTEKKLVAALGKLRFRKIRHVPGHRGKRGLQGLRVRPHDTSYQWQSRTEMDE
ncbi:phage/plasmid primase, P4 family [Inquilinus sp.]|jgi:putative DNA primase/helicase|uniref:phage/plasmid primase, P4 family n=1 Tax=Inquilinus sp. TaxID=1932117 RepID=UPI003783196E